MNQHVRNIETTEQKASSLSHFPSEVIEELGYYVYRLIDPRNGSTFYVGKGKGNRLFAHINDALGKEGDNQSDKLDTIRKIKDSFFEVAHVVHRHGMTEKEAMHVEAALINAYPGLTNIQGGRGNHDFGAMHAEEILRKYLAEDAVFNHKVMLIKLNEMHRNRPLYDQVRYSWRVNKARAERADYILAVRNGIIRGVFVADKWMRATKENFPEFVETPKRHGFVGKKADREALDLYMGKRVPGEYRRRGMASSFLYTYS